MIGTRLVFALLLLSPISAHAAETTDQPLEITADSALEWNRDQHQYVARKNAKAVQGDFSVSADTLTAAYDDSKGGTDITVLTAEGNVTITSGTSTATGNKAVYDVVSGRAVLTGTALKLSDKDLSVTAKEKFEYFSNDGKVIAYGRPLITSKEDTLEADQATAWLAPKGSATGGLQRAEAIGNVIIKTPSQTATGDKATYDATTSMAELIGHAKVVSGSDSLEGDRAEVNLKTKVSRMTGADGKGKVKGVFYPANRRPKPAASQ